LKPRGRVVHLRSNIGLSLNRHQFRWCCSGYRRTFPFEWARLELFAGESKSRGWIEWDIVGRVSDLVRDRDRIDRHPKSVFKSNQQAPYDLIRDESVGAHVRPDARRRPYFACSGTSSAVARPNLTAASVANSTSLDEFHESGPE